MNDMKGKLVELIRNAKSAMFAENLNCDIAKNYFIAEFLIANGVTVQDCLEEKQATSDKTSEWISVNDRLPNEEWEKIQREKDWDIYPCLCSVENHISKERYTAKLFYDGKHFMDDEFVRYTDSVAHWMPMPEPPKGD